MKSEWVLKSARPPRLANFSVNRLLRIRAQETRNDVVQPATMGAKPLGRNVVSKAKTMEVRGVHVAPQNSDAMPTRAAARTLTSA